MNELDPHAEWVKLVTRPSEILVVEDDEHFTEMMLQVMQDFHCIPTVASTGERAVELLKGPKMFDYVIADYKLPLMSGYDLIKFIFTMPQEIPVIVLSGAVSPEMILDVSALGIVPFVYKPTAGTIPALGRLFRTMGIKPMHKTTSTCPHPETHKPTKK